METDLIDYADEPVNKTVLDADSGDESWLNMPPTDGNSSQKSADSNQSLNQSVTPLLLTARSWK